MFLHILFVLAFVSNGDAAGALIFGKDIESWLIYTLIFFGFTSLGFIWTWLFGLFRDRKSGKPIKKPWE